MPTLVAFETITDLYLNLTKKYKNSSKTAFAYKESGETGFREVTWDEAQADIMTMASFLIEKGAGSGDRIAILSENRYEWAVVDLAIQLIGCVNVALYTSLPANQCEYILKDSESIIFFVSTGIQLRKAIEIFDNCDKLEHVIAFDEPKSADLSDKEFVTLYHAARGIVKELEGKNSDTIKKRSRGVQPENVATLIYTSGTTGKPKGAMLTHNNIVSNIKAAHDAIHIDENDRCLSFLPLSHSFERTGGYYAMIAGGAEIFYAQSVETVAKNMAECSPSIVVSVPRLFEKIYKIITRNVEEGSAVKKAVFNWAVDTGEKYSEGKRGLVSLQKIVADKLVFDKLKDRTGGNIRFFVSGGSALPADIGTFFLAAGLKILEGYGLTETSPIMTCNRYNDVRIGTVGKVIKGVTVGILRLEDNEVTAEISGEDYPVNLTSGPGEILCKGPNVMKGYWNNEEETKEIIDDEGWLHTGDIGRFVEGRLQITDRIKHMIVNAGGKNIYPGPIEDLFKTNKWIDQIMIVGEGESFMAALIVPAFEVLKDYAGEKDIQYKEVEDLLKKEEIQDLYKKEVRNISKELASHEKIRDFRLLPEEFTVEGGELTPTLKVKRRVIEDKYAALISSIFKNEE